MKKLALLIGLALMGSVPVSAQHSHAPGAKGPNGGLMEDVAGVHAELLTSGSTVTVNILDESSKPLPTKGYTASALITVGSERETLTLTPQGDSALKGEAKKAIAKGATIIVTLKTAAGKSGQVRFKP
jgi:nitrogen fixation protein FixH